MQEDPGIERSAARSHWDAVKGRKTHAGIAADAVLEGSQASAASQMGDDHTPLGDVGKAAFQLSCDELVGQAMEAVALEAAIMQGPWQGKSSHKIGLRRMEGRIERCRLHQIRTQMA